jgi:hypothetical protein
MGRAKSSRARWRDAPSATSPAPTADLEAVPIFNHDTAQQFTLFVQRTGIQPSEVGVIVNESDPQSVEVANYFKQKHGIPDSNTIHVNFGAGATWIDNATFAAIKSQITPQLKPTMQVLAGVDAKRPEKEDKQSSALSPYLQRVEESAATEWSESAIEPKH